MQKGSSHNALHCSMHDVGDAIDGDDVEDDGHDAKMLNDEVAESVEEFLKPPPPSPSRTHTHTVVHYKSRAHCADNSRTTERSPIINT